MTARAPEERTVMADGVENDPDLLRKAAQLKTAHVRDRLKGVLTNLDAALAGRGRPWGDDKIGHQFYNGAQGYGVGRANAQTNVKNAATSYDNYEKGQIKSADLLAQMNQANAYSFGG
ncbi:hypothetical protein [Nocardia sp. NPDC052566]|uniref:hypothetical protein n=1 Tax=Nocardia sp. NPDC052566 TaxID=3364330 RepID=UPI0037CB2119